MLEQENSVLAGSSAEKAGIQGGDIILEVDGIKIDIQNTLESQIQNKIP